MSDIIDFLTRQCAVNRLAFGDIERHNGVRDHIREELDEIGEAKAEGDQFKVVREWIDVILLAQDGALRAARELLREAAQELGKEVTEEGFVNASKVVQSFDLTKDFIAFINGEPTNEFVAWVVYQELTAKRAKNELREFPDWRQHGDVALNHKAGIHD